MRTIWRSLLFVPATRPERFEKAAGFGADLVCIDLEDAVAPADKDAARDNALEFLSNRRSENSGWILRINSPRTETGLRDMLAIIDSAAEPEALFVPKASSGEEMRWLDDLLRTAGSSVALMPIVESAEGLDRVGEIVGATPRITAVGFGSADYSAELGSDMSAAALAYGRGRIAAAAGGAGVAAIDGVWLDFDDEQGLREETVLVRAMGFDGKIAIHPRQVATINAVFTPNADEAERARRIVEAAANAKGGVTTIDGKMIDGPVVAAAQRILAAAEAGKTAQ